MDKEEQDIFDSLLSLKDGDLSLDAAYDIIVKRTKLIRRRDGIRQFLEWHQSIDVSDMSNGDIIRAYLSRR